MGLIGGEILSETAAWINETYLESNKNNMKNKWCRIMRFQQQATISAVVFILASSREILTSSSLRVISHSAIALDRQSRQCRSTPLTPSFVISRGSSYQQPSSLRPSAAVRGRSVSEIAPTTAHSASLSNNAESIQNSMSSVTTIRVLGLHGSGGNGEQFQKDVLENWNHYFRNHNDNARSRMELNITTITGPVSSGNNGFAWWKMPPFVRSFNATEYESFDRSEKMVLEALERVQPDLIIAHSQGAILLTALLALNRIPHAPRLGYILNGVAWPNPYTQQLESIRIEASQRILLLIGDQDRMNPPIQAHRVAKALQSAGYETTVVTHPKGHAVPIADIQNDNNDNGNKNVNEILDPILNWIQSPHSDNEIGR